MAGHAGLQEDAAQGPRTRQPDHHRAARQVRHLGLEPRTPRSTPSSTCCAASTRATRCSIFTEYADTADYVAEALKDAGIANVGLASGDSEDPSALARRFSPDSNKLPGDEEDAATESSDPIDVLVATDVLSEGQNLQDSHVVVNYDLPWAIIRIIQRAGRVDRVGQKSDTVNIYLISHKKVEQAIQLRQRIRRRLGDNAAAFGSDERFFGDDKEINILDDLYKGVVPGEDELEPDEGEADAVSEAWLVWSSVKEHKPELAGRVLRMQDMLHSTRDPYDHETRDRHHQLRQHHLGRRRVRRILRQRRRRPGRAAAHSARGAAHLPRPGVDTHRAASRAITSSARRSWSRRS